MKKLEFSIEISTPKEKVWEALWKDDNYRNWAAIFTEGSHIAGELKEGNTIQFLDTEKNGMFAKVSKMTLYENVEFLHQGEIKNGLHGEVTYGHDAIETYHLKEENGITTLSISMNAPEEYIQYFANVFPSVLSKIKEIAVATS